MIDRRSLILASATMAAASAATRLQPSRAAEPASTLSPVRLCLNMSTIRGQDLSVPEQVRVAAEAGYDSIEPWIGDLQKYVDGGGSLNDLRKQIADSGLKVDSAIGFAQWIVDDDEARAKALEDARRDMALVSAIGGSRIAAPPIGAHKSAGPSLETIATRYRALLEIGHEAGVIPQLELWGFSPTLSKLGELAYVATASGHPDACVLPDFYHIYKGGNDFASLGMIEASRMHVFHINDYPAEPSIEQIGDKDRVFPGDGVCPLPETIAVLLRNGFTGAFSLELFNPDYWKRDALAVAKEGLEKSRSVVAAALDLV